MVHEDALGTPEDRFGACLTALPFVVPPDVAAVSGSKKSWEVKGGAEAHLK